MDQNVIDPTGYAVILTEQAWAHVIRRHPEMSPFRPLVIRTVEGPDSIYLGKRDSSRRVYARRYARVPGLGNELTLLVFAGNEDRFIATAYFTAGQLRAVGQHIWPSK